MEQEQINMLQNLTKIHSEVAADKKVSVVLFFRDSNGEYLHSIYGTEIDIFTTLSMSKVSTEHFFSTEFSNVTKNLAAVARIDLLIQNFEQRLRKERNMKERRNSAIDCADKFRAKTPDKVLLKRGIKQLLSSFVMAFLGWFVSVTILGITIGVIALMAKKIWGL